MKGIRRILPIVLITLICVICLLFFTSLIRVGYYSRYEVGKTSQMSDYKIDNLKALDSLHIEYQWTSIDSISRNLIIAVLAVQDQDFYIHDGFAPINESDSILTNKNTENKKTISQLAAHSVFLDKNKGKINEWLETYYTILEEYMWGKDRILEVYMNTAPLGDGIFGAEAGAQIYFGKSAGYLTREEAAFLAILYMEPKDEKVDFLYPTEDICSKQFSILTKMALMTQIKVGKTPVDETVVEPTKPVYKRKWRA